MAAANDFKAYLVSEAAKLANTFDRLKVLSLIDSWFLVFQALDATRGNTLSAYSIAGRSGTRKSTAEMRAELDRLQREIEDLLYMRSMALVDNRGYYTMTWPFVGGTVTP